MRIAALDHRATGCSRRHFADDHALHAGQRTANPFVVAHINQLLASIPAFDLERAAAGRGAVQVFSRPRILVGGIGPRHFGIDDHRHRHAEIGQGQFRRLLEIDAEGF